MMGLGLHMSQGMKSFHALLFVTLLNSQVFKNDIAMKLLI